MTPFKRLGAYLNSPLQMTPAQRSMLARKLLEQSQHREGPNSVFGTANAALQGLLQRRSNIADREQQRTTEARQQGLAGALSRTSSDDPYKAEAAKRAAAIISGGLPGDPTAQAILQQQAKNAFGEPQRIDPQTTVAKINADVGAGNISPEVGQKLTEAEFNQDQRSIGDAEAALRKEFNSNLSGITSALRSLDNAKHLLNAGNPIAAQAALTAFIKAIDDSVVRPSEMEQYQGISGLARGLENRISLLLGQGPFAEDSKKQIMDSIEALGKSAEEVRRGAVSFYGEIAQSSGLRPRNVTGFNFGPSGNSARTNGGSSAAPKPPPVQQPGPIQRTIR